MEVAIILFDVLTCLFAVLSCGFTSAHESKLGIICLFLMIAFMITGVLLWYFNGAICAQYV